MKPSSGTPRTGLARRLAIAAAAAVPLGAVGLWIAVNRVEWLGPYVADGLRAVVGVEAVANLEDLAYGVQDRINRVVYRGTQPRAYWAPPSAAPPRAPPVAAAPETGPGTPGQEAQ